jgi:drug/metabolite transporter (DMT)-like permease
MRRAPAQRFARPPDVLSPMALSSRPADPPPEASPPASDTLRGALFMLSSGAAFAVMMAVVRQISQEIHPFEAAFFRNLLGLLFMLPWLAKAGLGVLKTGRFRIHALRAGFGLAAMLSLFYALSRLPLAETTALTFTAPLFATVGAALLLGERVRLRRWAATLVGFVGALIVLKPGRATIDPVAFIALASAVFIAGAMLTIKSLSRTEHPNAIVIMMGLLMTPASLIPAVFVWVAPSAETWAWIVLMGFAATIGQVCLTRAFAAAEASAVLPVDFSRLIFVSIVGYLLFGERPDLWTWVGAGLIVAATVYIAHREAQIARKAARRAAERA